jgi:hypothetical protein
LELQGKTKYKVEGTALQGRTKYRGRKEDYYYGFYTW